MATQPNAKVESELKEIDPPKDVQETMNKIVKAENEKMAAVDFATAVETRADGEKQRKRREQERKRNLNGQQACGKGMPFARNGSLCSRTQHLFRVHARQGERRQGSRKNHGERGKSNGCGKSGRIGAQIEEHGKVRLLDITDEQRAHPLRQHDPGCCTSKGEDGALGLRDGVAQNWAGFPSNNFQRSTI